MSKTRHLLSAVALTFATSAAMAQVTPSIAGADVRAMASTDQRPPLSREDVKAEVLAARQDGSLDRYDADSYVPDPSKMPVSTADDEPADAPVAVLLVSEEMTTHPAVAGGASAAIVATTVASASYYPVAIDTSKPMTREEVKADFRQARRTGENSPFNPDPYVNSPMPLTQE